LLSCTSRLAEFLAALSRASVNLSMARSFFIAGPHCHLLRFCTSASEITADDAGPNSARAPVALTDNATVLCLFPCQVLFFSLNGEIGTAVSMPEISAVEVGHQKG
jgi:hypothetical protein